MSTAIVDYGVGNLFSIRSSLKLLGCETVVTRDPKQLQAADRIILPGVGAFGEAMELLTATGLIPVLEAEIAAGKPLMGICLGMQLLCEKSYEYGEFPGLGWIPGEICPLAEEPAVKERKLKVPHMGWNRLDVQQPAHPLLKYLPAESYVYFVHSYFGKNCGEAVVASAEYGVEVPAIIARDNVMGCQFHPEKSGNVGISLLKAFTEL